MMNNSILFLPCSICFQLVGCKKDDIIVPMCEQCKNQTVMSDNDKRNQNLNEDDISSKNELNSTHTLESNVTLNINPNSEEKNDLENMNKSHDGQNTNDLKLFEEIIEDPNKIIYKPSRGKPQVLSSNEDTNILSMSQFLSFNYNYMDESDSDDSSNEGYE